MANSANQVSTEELLIFFIVIVYLFFDTTQTTERIKMPAERHGGAFIMMNCKILLLKLK